VEILFKKFSEEFLSSIIELEKTWTNENIT
jgi:hypothetical protein